MPRISKNKFDKKKNAAIYSTFVATKFNLNQSQFDFCYFELPATTLRITQYDPKTVVQHQFFVLSHIKTCIVGFCNWFFFGKRGICYMCCLLAAVKIVTLSDAFKTYVSK